jgi:hypothetical protein
MTLRLITFGKSIITWPAADRIFAAVREVLQVEEDVTIDFDGIEKIEPSCSSRIFRRLYSELGPQAFYERITLINISDSHYKVLQHSLVI